MARFDIMPYISEHGGHARTVSFQMGGGTTDSTEDTSWRTGNIVELDLLVGDLNPHVDGAADPAAGTFYIAGADSASIISFNNGTSGGTTHLYEVSVYDLGSGAEFTTSNVYDNTDTELDLDTGCFVGETADLWVDDATATVDGHKHGIDINGDFFVITRKLDSLGRNADISGATTTAVTFRRVA